MNNVSKIMWYINEYFERDKEMVNMIVKNSPSCVTVESLKIFMLEIFRNIDSIPTIVGEFKTCDCKLLAIMFYINNMKFFMRLDYDEGCDHDEYGWLEIYSDYTYQSYSITKPFNHSWNGYSLNTILCCDEPKMFGLSAVSDYTSHYNSTICRLLVAMEDAVKLTFIK